MCSEYARPLEIHVPHILMCYLVTKLCAKLSFTRECMEEAKDRVFVRGVKEIIQDLAGHIKEFRLSEKKWGQLPWCSSG